MHVQEEELVLPNADIDWTSKGVVTEVKNQGQCGSCWAFSTTGMLECYAKLKGESVSLSEQELVDCTRSYGNYGCSGGWPYAALKYIEEHKIAYESEYPYHAKDETCKGGNGKFTI